MRSTGRAGAVTVSTARIQLGMVPGWPDAIIRDFSVSPTTGPNIFRLVHSNTPSFGEAFIYRPADGGLPAIHNYYFNPDGSYADRFNLDGFASNRDGASMPDIMAEGRAFFALYLRQQFSHGRYL